MRTFIDSADLCFHATQAMIGADCATLPMSVFRQRITPPPTDIGLGRFLADARKGAERAT